MALKELTSTAFNFVTDLANYLASANAEAGKNWQYVYPVPVAPATKLNQAYDRVILKTTTTAKTVPAGVDLEDSRYSKTQEVVYLEIKRPARLLHPDFNNSFYFLPKWKKLRTSSGGAAAPMYIYDAYGDYIFENWDQIETPVNQHFVQMRLIAAVYDEAQADITIDALGVVNPSAKRSRWSKLSWYKDWDLSMLDSLYPYKGYTVKMALNSTTGVSIQQVKEDPTLVNRFQNGSTYVPISVAAQNEFTLPVRFWVNSDNDRIVLVISGDPTPNYNNYIIGFAYIGAIDNYDDVYDVVGNFAITTSSSTPPVDAPVPINTTCQFSKTEANPNGMRAYLEGTTTDLESVGQWGQVTTSPYWTVPWPANASYVAKFECFSFLVAASNGEAVGPIGNLPGSAGTISVIDQYVRGSSWNGGGQAQMVAFTVEMSLKVPKNATEVKVYGIKRTHGEFGYSPTATPNYFEPQAPEDYSAYHEVATAKIPGGAAGEEDDGILVERTISFTLAADSPLLTGGQSPSASGVSNEYFGVSRNPDGTGAPENYTFPDDFGDFTATGVLDVGMLQSASGLMFQRYFLCYITPNNNLIKDRFGFSKSIWTQKYHLSPMYLANGYEGYRGKFKDVLMCDGDNIGHTDPLIVPITKSRNEIIVSGALKDSVVAWKLEWPEFDAADQITLKVDGVEKSIGVAVDVATRTLRYTIPANVVADQEVEIVFNKEDRYQFFKITAPFNALFTGPNTGYCGLAIKTE